MSDSEIDITRRQSGKIHHLRSGRLHKLRVKTKFMCHMLEVEDVNFHFDSAVLLPDYGPFKSQEGPTPEQDRITGLAVLYACYRHAREHPQQAALVIGHTDRSGSNAYNQVLSEQRAENVFCALTGDREGWVDNVQKKSKVEDYQQILLWLTHSQGWQCDPGSKSNIHDAQTRQAVKDFQRQYNERFNADIDEDGGVGKQTWGAFFDVYMEELQYALGTDEAGLQEAQQSLQFVQCESIGCGEEFPITPDRMENYKSAIDRRVEILFFDEGEEPVTDCKKPRGTCVELYEKKMYCVTPIPVAPLPLPSGIAVHIMLRCLFKDPDDPKAKERPFPEGCPVTLEFPAAPSEEKKLGPDGLLDCFILREKKAFTLRFHFGGVTYLVAPPPDVLAPDKLVAESEVETLHDKGHRLFKLPQDFRLADADWQVSGTTTYNTATHHFEPLEDLSITNIGSAPTPAKVLLDPHWLYTRFEFFDRFFGHDHHDHERINLPPMMLEGFNDAAAASGTPDERCNWIVNAKDPAKATQCIPWILKKAGVKPDNKVLVQFRTKKNAFIVSDDATTRRVVIVTDAEKLKPGPDRLKFYDLPEVWRTQHYHARPASGDGAAFESLTNAQIKEATEPDKSLRFSLDDMVLTDQSLTPLAWVPTDRAAVFSHKFGKDGKTKLTRHGLYKPDTGKDQSFLTEEQTVEKTRNYVVDYPNWTRLIVAQGNLWSVFGERLPDKPGLPVGARAAVRWVDSAGLKAPGNAYSPRPGPLSSSSPTQDAFFAIQPFFEQQHEHHGGIGRFDLALLRCCDVKDGIEIASNLHYFRLYFNFTFTPTKDEKKANREAAGLTGADARKFEDKTAKRIIDIWNGNHSKNLHAAFLLPQDEAHKLKIKVRWFVQAIPEADKTRAHFEVRIFKDIRASMGSRKGTGQLSIAHTSANPHEAGHADSLGDEYIERSRSASYFQPGFYSFSPGSPFFFDQKAMMRGNREIRARYFWHVAEWLHGFFPFLFQVQHNTYTFKLPSHTDKPTRTHVTFPVKSEEEAESGERGNFDLFLYRLGDDEYNDIVLKTKASGGLITGDPFDSLLIVVVKMRFEFHTDDHNTIKDGVANIATAIRDVFNQKWYAVSEAEKFKRCLLHFSPRFLVTNYSGDAELNAAMGISKKSEYNSRVSEIKSGYGLHFDVETAASGTSEWDENWVEVLFGDQNDLHVVLDSSIAARFPRFFGNMVGLADGTLDNAKSYEPIVRKLLPDAKVKKA